MYFGTWIRRYFKIGQFLFGALLPSFVKARYFCFFRQLLLARRQADSLENFACKTFYTFYSSSFELTLGTKLRKFIFRRISQHETFHGEIQNRDFLVKASFKIPIIFEFQTMKKQKIKFLLVISVLFAASMWCAQCKIRPPGAFFLKTWHPSHLTNLWSGNLIVYCTSQLILLHFMWGRCASEKIL